MPTACPSGRYCQTVSAPPWWSSIGCAAQADPVVELASAEHVVARQPVVAVHATRLADTDLRPERDQRRAFVPGTRSTRNRAYSSACRRPAISASVRNHGSVALTMLAVGVAPDRIEPGHDRGDHPVDRRDVVAALAPRQVVVARVGGLGHQPVEFRLRDGPAAFHGRRSPSGTSSSASGRDRARRRSRSRTPRTRTGRRRPTRR